MNLFKRFFAYSLALGDTAQHRLYNERKQQLFAGLDGTIVEIGPGTGINLPYLPRDIRWVGLEPNPYLHDYIQEQAAAHQIETDVRAAYVEDADLPDDCADVVISTLVLCSVEHPDAALAAIRRLLKPGGEFLFIEHVAAPDSSWLHTAQRLIKPCWRAAGDGCRPDRNTGRAIERAGFERVTIDRFRTGLPVISPHIIGRAVEPN